MLNASRMNANTNSGTRMFRTGMSVIIFVVICVGLYYLYQFLYGNKASGVSVDTLTGIPRMTDASKSLGANDKAVAVTTLTGVMDGGQYSTSFWVYVSSTRGFTGTTVGGSAARVAHLMEISDVNRFSTGADGKGKTLLFIGLNPVNGTLVVRQTSSSDVTIDNEARDSSATSYKLDDLITNYNGQSMYTTNDKCDITNGIEYQRWVLISTVANGRTLDVYVDGKLARSCVYKGAFSLGNPQAKAQAIFGYNNNGNLKGFFSNGKFYNYAMAPDQVWALYMAGPGNSPSIGTFFSALFSTDVSFKSTSDLGTPEV
jgi:hypothetical protein